MVFGFNVNELSCVCLYRKNIATFLLRNATKIAMLFATKCHENCYDLPRFFSWQPIRMFPAPNQTDVITQRKYATKFPTNDFCGFSFLYLSLPYVQDLIGVIFFSVGLPRFAMTRFVAITLFVFFCPTNIY